MKSSRTPEVALPKKRARPDSECFLPEGGGDILQNVVRESNELRAGFFFFWPSITKFFFVSKNFQEPPHFISFAGERSFIES
jgi:hypothetical protein